MSTNILLLLEEITAIAQIGLNYAQTPYDRERYERLLALAAQQYSGMVGIEPEIIADRFRKDLGYITPKVGVSAAIFNNTGDLLLVRRSDDQTWCLPCGWAEVGETPQQSVAREVLEETGLRVRVGELIRLGTRMPGDFGLPHTTYHLLFFCEAIGGEIKTSHETVDVGFYPANEARAWHHDHQQEAQSAVFYAQRLVEKTAARE
jgi:ADP-ribose pyrophosphatase YjhB (NUDIX family)